MRRLHRIFVALTATVGFAAAASAQPIATVQWQSQPYCNLITVSVTQVGAMYRLEGFDDQCGGATRASVIGMAFQNPNGTIGIGLTIVATPGGAPVHLDATVTAPTFSGIWRDSVGGAGTWVLGAAAGGPPRPLGATGPAVMTVVPGPGITGGGSASSVNLAVNFAGSGAATTVAHSDHMHAAPGIANTAIGLNSLVSNATGAGNTALGFEALASSPAANGNTAVGAQALRTVNVAGGGGNTAVGQQAMFSNTGGAANVAVGSQALQLNTNGLENVAIGVSALFSNTDGDRNVAVGRNALTNIAGATSENIGIGYHAGMNATGGTANIFIGNDGAAADTQTIKIGTAQTRTFIAGVNGGVLDGTTDIPVSVDAFNKLGTTTSSARFKTDVVDLDGLTLQRLHPVSFRYLPSQGRGNQRQFGLIAEEVAEVLPELVVNDAEGQPYTVRYQQLPPLLLAEVQRLERERKSLTERLDAQAREIAELRAIIEKLRPVASAR